MTLEEAIARYPGAEIFMFGDGPALSDELLGLVRSGTKTATCADERDFEDGKEALPVVGRRDIALNWDRKPALVIESVSVERMRFCDVPEDFAVAEGEGTYEDWRNGHEVYFARNGGFDPQMMLVCERFRMIEDFAQAADT